MNDSMFNESNYGGGFESQRSNRSSFIQGTDQSRIFKASSPTNTDGFMPSNRSGTSLESVLKPQLSSLQRR